MEKILLGRASDKLNKDFELGKIFILRNILGVVVGIGVVAI